jgi:hypothetical protein
MIEAVRFRSWPLSLPSPSGLLPHDARDGSPSTSPVGVQLFNQREGDWCGAALVRDGLRRSTVAAVENREAPAA